MLIKNAVIAWCNSPVNADYFFLRGDNLFIVAVIAGIFTKDYSDYDIADRSFADADFDFIYNNDNSGNDGN